MHEPVDETPEEEPQEWTVGDFKDAYPLAYEVEKLIATRMTESNVRLVELLMLIRNCIARTRALLTQEEMHEWVHKLMHDAEYLLQTGQAFVDENDQPINMMLAEEREATGVEKFETPDTVPEDWV